jgi:hypothetical protein
MNCETCRDRMAELADGTLDAATADLARAHLAGCADCRRDFETLSRTLAALDGLPTGAPSPSLRARVMGDIEAEKLTQRDQADWASSIRAAAVPRPARRFAWAPLLLQILGACALVVVGFTFGERTATQRQLNDLRARVDTIGQLFEQSVLQKSTTGDRIETIRTAATIRKPDEQVINGLINSMAFDTSVNVRLNALNALYLHADQDVVRAGVLACLPRETNPLVQVAMIDFLVAARDRDAAPELRKLVADDHADVDVRESARRAIEQL